MYFLTFTRHFPVSSLQALSPPSHLQLFSTDLSLSTGHLFHSSAFLVLTWNFFWHRVILWSVWGSLRLCLSIDFFFPSVYSPRCYRELLPSPIHPHFTSWKRSVLHHRLKIPLLLMRLGEILFHWNPSRAPDDSSDTRITGVRKGEQTAPGRTQQHLPPELLCFHALA